MTAPLYRVVAGPHAGFVGRLDRMGTRGLLVLTAGADACYAWRDECTLLPPTAQLHAGFATLAEAGAALLMITALARAMRASVQAGPGDHP